MMTFIKWLTMKDEASHKMIHDFSKFVYPRKYQWDDDLWNFIQITYDDGTKNKDSGNSYLYFTNLPGGSLPTEDVWVGFP